VLNGCGVNHFSALVQGYISKKEAEAIAELFAAAPDMAEALEALLRLVPRPTSTVGLLAENLDTEHPEVTAARALLTRIRGNAQ